MQLHVFAKVRLLDIIEPNKNISNYQTYFNKIQSKHVDFLICKPNVTTLCVIEIDDNSHQNIKRAVRDNFVDDILNLCNIPIIRTLNIDETELHNKLSQYLAK